MDSRIAIGSDSEMTDFTKRVKGQKIGHEQPNPERIRHIEEKTATNTAKIQDVPITEDSNTARPT